MPLRPPPRRWQPLRGRLRLRPCRAVVSQIDPFGSLRRWGSPHPEVRGSDRPHMSLCLQSRRRGWSQTPHSIRSDRRIPCEWWGFGTHRACRHWGPGQRPRERPCGCRRRSRRQVLGPCRPVPGLVMPSLLDGGGERAISWEAGQDCDGASRPGSYLVTGFFADRPHQSRSTDLLEDNERESCRPTEGQT